MPPPATKSIGDRIALARHAYRAVARQRQRSPASGDHRLIDRHWQSGGAILSSAVTAWEIALLVDTGRIRLDLAVDG